MNKMNLRYFIAKEIIYLLDDVVNQSLRSNKPIRKDFPKWIQKKTLRRQWFRCNYCFRYLDVVNFDHIDGNPSNNSLSNCQALCPNCHAKKTRRLNII